MMYAFCFESICSKTSVDAVLFTAKSSIVFRKPMVVNYGHKCNTTIRSYGWTNVEDGVI